VAGYVDGKGGQAFVVSRLLLSGLPLVARVWQEPSDDGWTYGLAGLLPRKRARPVSCPAACLLLMDFDTAWLLHAGDRLSSRPGWHFFGGVFRAMTAGDHGPAAACASPPRLRVGSQARAQLACSPAWSR